MKLLFLGSLMFSGGSAVAMQNEQVNQTVTNVANQIKVMVQSRVQGNLLETVKESGYPYPSEEFLATLTEEQAFTVVSAIDVINATYDWSIMTDQEILDALSVVKADMHELYTDLGIESPQIQTRTRARKGNGGGNEGFNNNIVNPQGDQDGSCIDDEVPTSVDNV